MKISIDLYKTIFTSYEVEVDKNIEKIYERFENSEEITDDEFNALIEFKEMIFNCGREKIQQENEDSYYDMNVVEMKKLSKIPSAIDCLQ